MEYCAATRKDKWAKLACSASPYAPSNTYLACMSPFLYLPISALENLSVRRVQATSALFRICQSCNRGLSEEHVEVGLDFVTIVLKKKKETSC